MTQLGESETERLAALERKVTILAEFERRLADLERRTDRSEAWHAENEDEIVRLRSVFRAVATAASMAQVPAGPLPDLVDDLPT